jgi:polysaccharide biosynthesis protein PslG
MSNLRRPALVLALALCGLMLFGQAGEDAHGANARTSAASLLDGVNIGGVSSTSAPASADKAIATAAKLHAQIVRVVVPWSALEPLEAGQLDQAALAYTDRLMADAARAGIRVIMTVDSTPCWASSAPRSLLAKCSGGSESAANAWPPSVPASYATFVAYLAKRYGSQPLTIEIWNEPDQSNQAYLAGPNKPQRYAELLRAAYPAIKAANPGVSVLGGSIVGPNGAFLRAMYKAGIKGFYDGLSVHYYTLTLAALRSIREVQLANGDSKPLWLAEFGWSSCWPKRIEQEQGCVTSATQAANISNTLRALAHAPYVQAAVVYKLSDSTAEAFGLTAPSGAPKPSFAAFAGAAAAPLGAITGVSLSLRKRGSRVLASGSGPVGDYMRLEALENGVLRYHALFTLDRFNRYSVALPAVLGTHGLTVRVYQYWAGSGRAASKSI